MPTYASIQSFYQYRMVDPSMSVLSNGLSKKLSVTEKDRLWGRLLSAADISDKNFIFGPLLWSWEKEIVALQLSDSTLTCDQVKGVIKWESSLIEFGDKIHKLDLLFLRIRNAFAHGRIAAIDGFLVFEDRDDLQQLNARIVLNEKVLLSWMKIIQSGYGVPKDIVVEKLDTPPSGADNKHIVPSSWISSRVISSNAISELKALCDLADGQRLEKQLVGIYTGTYYLVPCQEPIKEELKRFLKTAYIPLDQNGRSFVLEVYISNEERTVLVPEDIFHFCEREIVLAQKLRTKRTAFA